MITILKVNGTPERELTHEEIKLTSGFPARISHDKIEYLTKGDDDIYAQWMAEYPAAPPQPQISPALAAVLSAPPEDLAKIREILGIK